MNWVTYPQLSSTDQRIVDLLRQDGRRPYRAIARELGVSESMVRKRANRLLESGWMRILAISDPLQLGVPFVATTYARVSPALADGLATEIASDPRARYVAVGIGGSNLVFESLHKTSAEAHEFLQGFLARDGVVSAETIHVVDIKKSVWDWEIPVEKEESA
ncbi:MAG TPA: Lrp/AsnC family transcriptional regulator [Deinococcales bacterium]|nr:Lrp/AsnC family transcriptional regulator [Deinococcales bacterium]